MLVVATRESRRQDPRHVDVDQMGGSDDRVGDVLLRLEEADGAVG